MSIKIKCCSLFYLMFTSMSYAAATSTSTFPAKDFIDQCNFFIAYAKDPKDHQENVKHFEEFTFNYSSIKEKLPHNYDINQIKNNITNIRTYKSENEEYTYITEPILFRIKNDFRNYRSLSFKQNLWDFNSRILGEHKSTSSKLIFIYYIQPVKVTRLDLDRNLLQQLDDLIPTTYGLILKGSSNQNALKKKPLSVLLTDNRRVSRRGKLIKVESIGVYNFQNADATEPSSSTDTLKNLKLIDYFPKAEETKITDSTSTSTSTSKKSKKSFFNLF